jgi:arylsulfatase
VETKQRPNVLLFTTDQHRGDFLSIAGHPLVETPNLDSLIQHGLYFPNAYTEIPSTTGARRCLLSGKGSYHNGLIGYSSKEWHERNTLAQVLADNGYHCLNVGFRNLHPRRKLYGFHSVMCNDLVPEADDYWDWLKEKVGPTAHERSHGVDANGWTARTWNLDEYLHPTNWTIATALEMLRRRDPTKPFFLWVSCMRPHSPYDPPEFFWDMYAGRPQPAVPVGDWADRYAAPNPGLDRRAWYGKLTDEQTYRARAAYMGVVTHIDYQFGYLMERLALDRLLDNTLIVFVADHGDMLGDHNLHRKTYAYEGSARIPFLLRYPSWYEGPVGRFEPVVGKQDVMPTILDILGIPGPEGMTGRSVLAAARGEPWREYLHGEHSPCYAIEPAMQYLTDGREKYIYFPYTGEEQLFDLRQDRGELRDLAKEGQCADRVELWRERLVDVLSKRDDGFTDGRKLAVRREWWGPDVG